MYLNSAQVSNSRLARVKLAKMLSTRVSDVIACLILLCCLGLALHTILLVQRTDSHSHVRYCVKQVAPFVV
jgi:hypothetical protein